ncbi:hypothetical protein H2201_002180 [Coniosporium apollinis]|uniref:Uncharacterized protein n=1 Tax=Coniosporium apollinis TaxID=61459 RepID=A0ABQ9P250_9PEZI|nr:hypothetical protein H2201_002180 [Coniosporium apollinis]
MAKPKTTRANAANAQPNKPKPAAAGSTAAKAKADGNDTKDGGFRFVVGRFTEDGVDQKGHLVIKCIDEEGVEVPHTLKAPSNWNDPAEIKKLNTSKNQWIRRTTKGVQRELQQWQEDEREHLKGLLRQNNRITLKEATGFVEPERSSDSVASLWGRKDGDLYKLRNGLNIVIDGDEQSETSPPPEQRKRTQGETSQTKKRNLLAEVNEEEGEEQDLSQLPTKRRQATGKTTQTKQRKLALEAREKEQEEEDSLPEIPYKEDVMEEVRSTDPRQQHVSRSPFQRKRAYAEMGKRKVTFAVEGEANPPEIAYEGGSVKEIGPTDQDEREERNVPVPPQKPKPAPKSRKTKKRKVTAKAGAKDDAPEIPYREGPDPFAVLEEQNKALDAHIAKKQKLLQTLRKKFKITAKVPEEAGEGQEADEGEEAEATEDFEDSAPEIPYREAPENFWGVEQERELQQLLAAQPKPEKRKRARRN